MILKIRPKQSLDFDKVVTTNAEIGTNRKLVDVKGGYHQQRYYKRISVEIKRTGLNFMFVINSVESLMR